jgi:RHS repeat-associated protein
VLARCALIDSDGRVIGEYGASATDVKAEYIWVSPEVANDNVWGGGDGIGGYAPLAVSSAPLGGTATLSWIHANHIGAPLLMTDATGTAVSPSGYTQIAFPGQLRTLPDLYYNRYRDYDPTTGRYVQADPIGLDGDANPYAYAINNALAEAGAFEESAATRLDRRTQIAEQQFDCPRFLARKGSSGLIHEWCR